MSKAIYGVTVGTPTSLNRINEEVKHSWDNLENKPFYRYLSTLLFVQYPAAWLEEKFNG